MEKFTSEMASMGQSLSVTYLSKKDVKKKTGEITVVTMHSPFSDSGGVEAQMLRGFTHEVKLSFAADELPNRMYPPRTSKYVLGEWGKKMSLAVATGPAFLAKALDMENPANNQQAEGMINGEKTHVPDIAKHASDVAAWMHYRWNTINESSKQMIAEMEKLDGYLAKQKGLKEGCGKRKERSGRKSR